MLANALTKHDPNDQCLWDLLTSGTWHIGGEVAIRTTARVSDFTEDDLYDMTNAKKRHPYAPAGDGEMFSIPCYHATHLGQQHLADDKKKLCYEETISDAEPSQIVSSGIIRDAGHDSRIASSLVQSSLASVAESTQVTKLSYYDEWWWSTSTYSL